MLLKTVSTSLTVILGKPRDNGFTVPGGRSGEINAVEGGMAHRSLQAQQGGGHASGVEPGAPLQHRLDISALCALDAAAGACSWRGRKAVCARLAGAGEGGQAFTKALCTLEQLAPHSFQLAYAVAELQHGRLASVQEGTGVAETDCHSPAASWASSCLALRV